MTQKNNGREDLNVVREVYKKTQKKGVHDISGGGKIEEFLPYDRQVIGKFLARENCVSEGKSLTCFVA